MSRLLMITTQTAARQPALTACLWHFRQRTRRQWANTELIRQTLTQHNMAECIIQTRMADYLAWGLCPPDLQAGSHWRIYLQQLTAQAEKPHLSLFISGFSTEDTHVLGQRLAAQGFRQIAWIDTDNDALAAQQLDELMAC